ncbi:hypothetical protein GK047_12555 [Paenibacillus sp. SYP-B3998]|uniref:Uncharacterized protein n=1 Tax=Paenibacillus sp. SYP-B3998 TaxID=2678564 RepID=A0A6G3ZZ39_9BACL|nr:hypothetical protein [Paenibacillus sp. SYP-B3998]NEW06841.1 hypothetical protein [Paenibacillus sp. SYP-B3998]
MVDKGKERTAEPNKDHAVIKSSTSLKIVNAKEVAVQYEIKDFLYDDGQYEWLLLAQGDVQIDGHLHLDGEKGWEDTVTHEAWRQFATLRDEPTGHTIAGLVIDGQLTVNGSIINSNLDWGPYLIVKGNCHAQNIVSGGAYIRIDGDATVEEAVYGSYNHGELTVGGKLETKIYINEDHCVSAIKGLSSSFAFVEREEARTYGEDDSIPSKLKKLLTPTLLLWGDLWKTLCSGQSIVKKKGDKQQKPQTIEEWVPLVWSNRAHLKKVPAALKDEAFYLQLFAENAPIADMDVREIVLSISPAKLTENVCAAALQLSPLSLLLTPTTFDLAQLYEKCFLQVKNPESIFYEIPERYRSEAMHLHLARYRSRVKV